METRSRLAVILHADIVGSTVLVQRDERIAHDRMQAAFRCFSDTISAYAGNTLELRGDALVAEFERPSDAVLASLSFQATNREQIEKLDDDIRPVVRIGIALGEVVIAERTVTGAGVVLAQRLEQLAEEGGLCISAAIREALPARLPLRIDALGEKTLKGFEEPVRAFSVIMRNGAAVPAPEPFGLPSQGQKHLPGGKVRWMAGALALAVLAGGLSAWLGPWRSEPAPPAAVKESLPLPDKPSVAVLPFKSIGGDDSAEYFSDGLTNDLITDLSKFHGLFVSASNSVFSFKESAPTAKEAAAELGVRYVLNGSVQRAAERVRVNAELIEADTGKSLWAERFDRDADDIFAVQDELVKKIVVALTVRVDEIEMKRSLGKRATNLQAYDYYLRGQALDREETRTANFESQRMFKRAIELEPGFALGYTGLGRAVLKASTHGWTNDPRSGLKRAHDLAQAAIGIESHAEGHALLGVVYMLMQHYDLAQSELDRAIQMNPNDARSYATLGEVNLWTSRLDLAEEAFRKSMRLDPKTSADVRTGLGTVLFLMKMYRDAEGELESAAAKAPDNAFTQAVLAAVYGKLGQAEQAEQAAEKTRKLHPFFTAAAYRSAFARPEHGEMLADGLAAVGLD